ncbi:uridine kinase [Neomicrococcus aestuarii]|uniref:uridine kinase family protein n=1 Tax=Neomicrococcus aestuarii TaxID=556325 RepID=UPI00161B542F
MEYVSESSGVQFIILGGPSGSGKSYLAERFGAPHIQLDNYYREIAEDAHRPFPRTPYGEIDWDHHETWNDSTALDSMMELLENGRTTVPAYDISTSSYVGSEVVELAGGPIIAEGIFADRILQPLRQLEVPVQGIYVREPSSTTALRRFARDVSESRKPVPFLVKRGLSLWRAEASLRNRYLAAGFQEMNKPDLKSYLSSLPNSR